MNLYLFLSIFFLFLMVFLFVLKKKFSLKKIEDFFDNGKIKRIYYVDKQNLKCSWEYFFYPNGKVNKKQYWENDILAGKAFIYYPNGKTYIKAQYKNNKLDQYCLIYSPSNKLLRKIFFENGIKKTDETYNLKKDNDVLQKDIYKNLKNDYSKEINEEIKIYKEIYNNKKYELDKEIADYDNKNWFSKSLVKVNFIKKKKKAKSINEVSEKIINDGINKNKKLKEIYKKKENDLNEAARTFGLLRIDSLTNTVKSFKEILDYMGQKSKVRIYEILEQVNINSADIVEIKNIEMSAQKFATATSVATAAGVAAWMGVPTAVTTAVTYIGTASTGTAIASLHGAAATNATLAWLGGGSIASGGGGMALGSSVLAGITFGAATVAAAAIGTIVANIHYSNKLTEAHKKFAEVGKNLTLVETNLKGVNQIITRIEELYKITLKVNTLAKEQLSYLKPLSFNFDINNNYYLKNFQMCASLCKTLGELAQIQVLDKNGNLSATAKTKIIDIENDIKEQNYAKGNI